MNKNENQLKIGIILNYVNMILGNLIPIFYTPIMLSLLGQHEYGLYKLSSSVTSYLSLISLGLGSAITRYLVKARIENGKEEEEKIFGLFNIIFSIISIASFIIGIILVFNLHIWYGASLSNEELNVMKIIVFLMVCNMSISFSSTPDVSIVSTHEKFIFLQSMNILSTCIMPLFNLVALILGFASIGMAISSLLIQLLIKFSYTFYVKKSMKLSPKYEKIEISFIKEIFNFSFWIFLSNLVGQLYNSTDTVMIGAIPALATVGVAVYNIGATFNSIVFSLTTGVSSLLTPKTNKMVFGGATNEELTDFASRIGRIQCYIICLIVSGFICFGQPFISFYAGAGYEESYWVAVFMMIPNMIPLVQSVCLSIIVAQNKHKFRSIVYLGIAITNVIGTWLLIQRLGVVGAALMTGISLVFGQGLVMNWYYQKVIKLDMFGFWKKMIPIYTLSLVMVILTVIISKFINFYNLANLLLGIIIYTVVYCIVNYFFIMNSYEKNTIKEIIKL